MNLVVNARDAMPAGGRLSIETSNAELDELEAAPLGLAAGRYVRLSVRDNGCGMTAATCARIFEPFFTTKDVGKGTGLGLSTVFGIVQQSEGAIAVTSDVGRGTTFHIYLPRVDAAVETIAPVEARPIHARSGNVLVVEDDERLRAVLQRRLTSWGYAMQVAPTAEAALELLESSQTQFDLIMTDLVMPGMDGRTMAARILAARPRARILFMSGYSEHASVKTAAVGPHEHFIAKPFTSAELAGAIDRTLGAP
jgi:CheY-like chemotaxis protein